MISTNLRLVFCFTLSRSPSLDLIVTPRGRGGGERPTIGPKRRRMSRFRPSSHKRALGAPTDVPRAPRALPPRTRALPLTTEAALRGRASTPSSAAVMAAWCEEAFFATVPFTARFSLTAPPLWSKGQHCCHLEQRLFCHQFTLDNISCKSFYSRFTSDTTK